MARSRDPVAEAMYLVTKPIAPLGAGATIAANDVAVLLSRKDGWIRAASSALVSPYVPGVLRVAGAITLDIILCNGKGRIVPSAIFEVITGAPAAGTAATVVGATTTTNGSVLVEEPIVTVLVGAAVLGNQTGRRSFYKADADGRFTGVLTMAADQNQTLIIKYGNKFAEVLVREAPIL